MSRSRPADHPRVQDLRKRIALDRLPPELGTALLVTSSDAQRRALRQLGQLLTDPLGPSVQELTRHAVCATVHEFALLAANQGVLDPSAADLLRRVSQAEAGSLLSGGTTEGLLAAVAAAVREQITRHPVLATHAVALQFCLRRYLDHVRPTIPQGRPAQAPPPPPGRAADERHENVAPFLYHDLRQYFGARVHQACVTVQVPAASTTDATDCTVTIPGSNPEDGVYLAATDHIAFLHPSTFLATPTEGTEQTFVAVHAGPVPLHELVRAYQSALLLARMIRLGWARPPGPVHCRPHSPADIPLELLEQLAPHLELLLPTPLPHRIELARTLRRVLVKPDTLQQHAKALNISTSTLRQRLTPLQPILRQNGLPPSQILALASVLPALISLWKAELEQPAKPTGAHEIQLVVSFSTQPETPPLPRDVP